MNKVETITRINADGMIKVAVPASIADENGEVRVTVEPASSKNGTGAPSKSDREAYKEFVRRTAGAWLGELERPEQGVVEEREWWP